MIVSIFGAGIAGATLAYLLKRRDIDFYIFDKAKPYSCGITPCGWGVNYKDFLEICRLLNLNPDNYILRCDTFCSLDGIKVDADVATIDKPRLISDLLTGIDVKYAAVSVHPHDSAIIDATGISRDYSPQLGSPASSITIQQRVKLSAPTSPQMYFSPDVGYAWLIPISKDGTVAHLGSGAFCKGHSLKSTMTYLQIKSGISIENIICSCQSEVRATGPILPMTTNNTTAIGEAAGLVSPLSGGGNIPAMWSAYLLAQNLDNPKVYEKQIVAKYGYFSKEARTLKLLESGKVLTLRNIISIVKMMRFIGLHPTLPQIFYIILTLRNRLAAH